MEGFILKKLLIILCIILLFVLTGCGENTTYEDTEFTKLSLNNDEKSTQNLENVQTPIPEPPKPVETEINSYTSPVLDKAEGRVNNLKIGCSYINRLYC